MMIAIAIIARSANFPVEEPVPLRELPRITWHALPALMMPVVLLGGIYSGVTTPTEAAAVAAAYALLVSVVLYRSVTLSAILQRAADQRANHGLDRHADRRRAGLQLSSSPSRTSRPRSA